MPHITFLVDVDGLSLAVMIGLNGQKSFRLVSLGQPVPAPLLVRGIIDTGSDVTCVAAQVLRQLPLICQGHRTTQTVAGSVQVDLFDVSLTVLNPRQPTQPLLVLDQLTCMELPQPPSSSVDALVGLDVVLQLLLVLDGGRKEFLLAD
jgi:hypothetical protein